MGSCIKVVKKKKIGYLMKKKSFQEDSQFCTILTKDSSTKALGILVAFLKQPYALPGRAPQKNKYYIFFNYF
jgi:hypothetical protein